LFGWFRLDHVMLKKVGGKSSNGTGHGRKKASARCALLTTSALGSCCCCAPLLKMVVGISHNGTWFLNSYWLKSAHCFILQFSVFLRRWTAKTMASHATVGPSLGIGKDASTRPLCAVRAHDGGGLTVLCFAVFADSSIVPVAAHATVEPSLGIGMADGLLDVLALTEMI